MADWACGEDYLEMSLLIKFYKQTSENSGKCWDKWFSSCILRENNGWKCAPVGYFSVIEEVVH